MHYYLLDENCFDQYSIILDGGTTTAIYLNAVPEPVEIAKREVSTWGLLFSRFLYFHELFSVQF